MLQNTLKSEFRISGIGVHSGKICSVVVSPAPEDLGIVFKDNKTGNIVTASYDKVHEAVLCTKLIQGSFSISTIEHLSASLYALNISNAIIETENGEIPILDGSAKEFVEKISQIGVQPQQAKRKFLKITKNIKLDEGNKWITIEPSSSLSLHVSCDFNAKGLQTLPYNFNFATDDFATQIAPARTFGFLQDVDFLRKNNLAIGASLDNTVVFDNNGATINKEGLRFENEPVRHKILDAIGDLAMAQYMIIGKYTAHCPGHKMNNMLLRKIFSDNSCYEIISC